MKFLVSIVSKDENFSITEDNESKFISSKPGSEIIKTKNNSENITSVNNRMIEKSLSGGFDFIIMMHSDVTIDLEKLANHIEECSGKYGIMGLCGCEKISVSECPLNWFCGSRRFPDGRWGCVTHGELGDSVSFFSGKTPNVTDHPVSCIDGLCIIMSKDAIKTGIRFDENLRFNCYDTQISLDALMNYGIKVGVLVEPDLKHFSVGKSILEDSFLKDEFFLRKRFGFPIPPGSRLEEYVSANRMSV